MAVKTAIKALCLFLFWNIVLIGCSPKDSDKTAWEDKVPGKILPKVFPSFEYIDVTLFKGKLVLLGTNTDDKPIKNIINELWISTNAVDWERIDGKQLPPPRFLPVFISDDTRVYIIGGSQVNNVSTNEIWRSTDLLLWEPSDIPNDLTPRWSGIAHRLNDKLVLLGGMNDKMSNLFDIWILYNNQWELVERKSLISPDEHNTRSMSNNVILYYDFHNKQIVCSNDGKIWDKYKLTMQLFTESDPADISVLEYKDTYYLMFCPNSYAPQIGFEGGYIPTDIVYRSTDLENWELLSEKVDTPYQNGEYLMQMPYKGLPYHTFHAFLAFKDNLWVIAREGDIWKSTDGRVWEQVAGPSPVFVSPPEPHREMDEEAAQ